MRKFTLGVAAAALMLAAAGSASAATLVGPAGNAYIGGLTQIHAVGPQSNTTVYGTAYTYGDVTFTSSDTLSTTGAGVAFFVGPFNDLQFFLTDPTKSFDEANFNLNASGVNGGNPVPVYADITAFFFGGGSQLIGNNVSLGNGQNKFSVTAGLNESITAIGFNFYANTANTIDRTVVDIRQVELGALSGGPGPVPEPATWAMMIGGFAAVGSMVRRRKAGAVLA